MEATPPSVTKTTERHTQYWLLALLVVLITIYAYTLLPGPGYSGDTSKFQFIGSILGTAHEPGEPLYIMATALFAKILPVGSIAWRVNAFSAVMAVGAVAGLYLIMLTLKIARPTAFGFSLAAGLSYTFWSQAVVAEVYSLNAFFVVWTLLLFLRWRETRDMRLFLLAVFVYALSFGNHLTMITLLPALILFVLLVDASLFVRPRIVAAVTAIVLLCACQYLYIIQRYYAAPPGVYLEIAAGDIPRLWYYLTGGQFHGDIFPLGVSSTLISQGPKVAGYLFNELSFFIPLVLFGMYMLAADGAALWLLLLGLAGTIVFTLGYGMFDNFVYLIPAYLIAMVFAAAGFDAMARPFPSFIRNGLSLAVIPLILLVTNLPVTDRHQDTEMDRITDQVLQTAGENSIIYVPNYHYAMAFWYKVYCEGWQQRNIHVLYDEYFSPDTIIAGYLRSGIPIHVPLTRSDIPPGLHVFLFTGFDRQYIDYALNGDDALNARYAAFCRELGEGLVRQMEHHDLNVTKYYTDCYEITTSSKQTMTGTPR